MVSDEDRDYMWAEYAKDPRMKANIGIRRRLAPLLEGDRNQSELFIALLLSLPGSPVLYYGDEIGMGDNIWLGDRDGVRTPMQWSPDRNAGFSRSDPARLYLPAIMDPQYGYQTINVEAQSNSTASFLHWTRRMVEIRKQHAAFSVGAFTDLGGSNPTVLSYVLHYPGDADGRRRTRTHRAVREQSLPVPPAGGTRPAPARRRGSGGTDRRVSLPASRRAALPAYAAWTRVLLVRTDAPGGVLNR